jgi:hypothetical protein
MTLPVLASGCSPEDAMMGSIFGGSAWIALNVIMSGIISSGGFNMEPFAKEGGFYKESDAYRGIYTSTLVASNIAGLFAIYFGTYYMGVNNSPYPLSLTAGVTLGATLLTWLGAPVTTLLAESFDKNRQAISTFVQSQWEKLSTKKAQEFAAATKLESAEDLTNLKHLGEKDAATRAALLYKLYVIDGERLLKNLGNTQSVALGKILDELVTKALDPHTDTLIQNDILKALIPVTRARPENDPVTLLLRTLPLASSPHEKVRETLSSLHQDAFAKIRAERRIALLKALWEEFSKTAKITDKNARTARLEGLVHYLENLMPLLTESEKTQTAATLAKVSHESGVALNLNRLLPYLSGTEDLTLFGADPHQVAVMLDAQDPILAPEFFDEATEKFDENEIITRAIPRIFNTVNQKNWMKFLGKMEVAFLFSPASIKVKWLQSLSQGIFIPRAEVRNYTIQAVSRLARSWQLSPKNLDELRSFFEPWRQHDVTEVRMGVEEILTNLEPQETSSLANTANKENSDDEAKRRAAQAAASVIRQGQ